MLETLCNQEPLWDDSLSWNTTSPRLTRCFVKTLPVWTTSTFLWITGVVQLCLLYQKRAQPSSPSIPCNFLNISKCATVALIILANFIQFIHDLVNYVNSNYYHYQAINWADLSYSLINVATFVSF